MLLSKTTMAGSARQFMIRCLGVAGLFCLATLTRDRIHANERPPNILFVLADDQRIDTIRALGNREIHTPNLDGLVERGFHFTNAYCMGSMTGAVCLPSRTMLITGRSLWRIPANPQTAVAPPEVPLLPIIMRDAGHVTFHSGKPDNACRFGNAAFQTNLQSGKNPNSAAEHAENVIRFLQTHDDSQPFFVYLAPPVPHDPRVAPSRFTNLYDPSRLTLSANFLPKHPFDNGDLSIRDEKLAAIPRSPGEMRQHLADYYATISHLDFELGRILATLDSRGWTDSTVVIYSSDQGLAVGGRHGLMGKQNLYEHVKPPLIFAGPGIPHGQSDALVYLFDLFPTICSLARAPVPDIVEGKNLMPIIQGNSDRVRDSLFAAYKNCQRMLRDNRWKLIAYNASGVRNLQLFDLVNDPHEIHNLAGDSRYATEQSRLEKLLSKSRRDFDDPVTLPFTQFD